MASYLVVKPDALVVNPLGKPHGSLGVSRYAGITSPAYFVADIDERAAPRFLHYLLRTRLYISEYERRGKWMPPSQFNISWDQFKLIRLDLPARPIQEEIADFLGRECERINALIAELDALLGELRRQADETVVRLTDSQCRVRLRYRLATIEQGWSPECLGHPAEGDEYGVLKVGAVNYGRFRPSENKALPPELSPRLSLVVAQGDVLMSRANTRELVGSAALVERTDGFTLLLSDKIYRLAPTTSLRRRFLVSVLNSRVVRSQLEALTSGASSSMQNISQEIVRSLEIPDLAYEEQKRVEEAVAERQRSLSEAEIETARLRATLTEYRDALITEAVTGKLDPTRLSEQQLDESARAIAEGATSEILA